MLTEQKQAYFVYVDILGFENLPKEIAQKIHLDENLVRENFLSNPLKKAVESLKIEFQQFGSGISAIEGSDSYVISCENLDSAFRVVGKISSIKLPFEGYSFIPLEFALGIKTTTTDVTKLYNRTEVIQFLKDNLISPYREYSKAKGRKLTNTFILLSKDVYAKLDGLDKDHCKKISHQKTFSVIETETIQNKYYVYQFLKKIGKENSKLYARINDLYVPPTEYTEIQKLLNENQIVFLTGTKEYGKTYTAVRLLWEYFVNGYDPLWIAGDETRQRSEVRKKLLNIESELKPKHIIYFEDPFGKTKYESNETLEREITSIIDTVKRIQDVFVIITSREEVFKEFEKEKLSFEDLKRFEKRLNIKVPSYNRDARVKILDLWGKHYNCQWMNNFGLVSSLHNKMYYDPTVLPSPLSIKSFAITSSQISNFDEIVKKINEKSHETTKSFAKEMLNMSEDKILFLALVYLMKDRHIPSGLMKQKYDLLVQNLKLENAWDFEALIEWFQGDKIDFSKSYDSSESLSFSHPSYAEAFEAILLRDQKPSKTNSSIVCPMLFALSEDPSTISSVMNFLDHHFFKVDKDTRQKLLDNLNIVSSYDSWILAKLTVQYVSPIPVELSKKILFKLIDSSKTITGAAHAISTSFKDLPVVYRDNLLLKLSQNHLAARETNSILFYHYRIVDEKTRTKIISNLLQNVKYCDDVSHTVLHNISDIGNQERKILLNLIFQNEIATEELAKLLTKFFHEFEPSLRNDLFIQLADYSASSWYVSGCLLMNFHKFNENVRNVLFLKLLAFPGSLGDMASVMVKYSSFIPVDLQDQSFPKIFKTPNAVWRLARELVHNYSNLSKTFRENLLKKLLLQDTSTKIQIAEHLDEILGFLSDQLKIDIFSILHHSEDCKGFLARVILANYNNLPKQIQSMVLSLKDDTSIRADIAWSIALHFDNLPEEIQNLLKTLTNDLQDLVSYFAQYGNMEEKKNALEIVTKCKTIIGVKSFTDALTQLSKDDDDFIRLDAKNLIELSNLNNL